MIQCLMEAAEVGRVRCLESTASNVTLVRPLTAGLGRVRGVNSSTIAGCFLPPYTKNGPAKQN